MKKIVSLILALVMVFALATTASAAATDVVGSVNGNGPAGGHKNSIEDGVSVGDFTATNGAQQTIQIDVTLSSTVSKYAIDMDYDTTALSMGGSVLTWDVNKMAYVTTTPGSDPAATSKTIKITNYSDQPVNAYVTISDSDAADGITLTSDNTSANKLRIEKATAGLNGANGTATVENIVINLVAQTNWQDVVTYYTNKGETGTVTVATATITVEPVPAP